MGEPQSADVLRKALDVLRERGRTTGTLAREDGSVCDYGALQVAAYGAITKRYLVDPPGAGTLAEVIREHWPDRVGGSSICRAIAGFNDHEETDDDENERAFEKAIARAEEMVE